MRNALLAAALIAACPAAGYAEAPEVKLTLPQSGVVKVAFVISDQATLIDIVGPMTALGQAQAPGTSGFETFTVSETRTPVQSGGLSITPRYTFADVPDADIVVIPAQPDVSEAYLSYIRDMAKRGKLMLSVCTGVKKLAAAGLLDGLEATSHHDFIDAIAKTYPKVHFLSDRAYVHSAPMIYTAGGEMSGVELGLHIVELYFDHDVAVKTARYMDYRGPAWQN